MPRFAHPPLPLAALDLADGGDRIVEYHRVRTDLSGFDQRTELGAADRIDSAGFVAEPDGGGVEESDAELVLDRFERIEKRIDRTAGHPGRTLVGGDQQEPVVSPIARSDDRLAVRRPSVDEAFGGGEELFRIGTDEGLGRAEHPRPGIGGQAIERYGWQSGLRLIRNGWRRHAGPLDSF